MSTTTTIRTLSRTQKVLLSMTALGVTASMAGLGSFATFTDSDSGSTAIDTGVVDIALGTSGTADNRLSVAATDIVPGDTIERAVTLSVTANTTSTLSKAELTTTAANSNVLTTDETNGLQMVVDRCSVAWTEAGTGPYTYTCGGTTSSVLASRAIIGADLTLSNVALAADSSNYLRVTVTLPAEADNSFQDLANTVTYAFTGTQRTATSS